MTAETTEEATLIWQNLMLQKLELLAFVHFTDV